jgi:hypothetical protein
LCWRRFSLLRRECLDRKLVGHQPNLVDLGLQLQEFGIRNLGPIGRKRPSEQRALLYQRLDVEVLVII